MYDQGFVAQWLREPPQPDEPPLLPEECVRVISQEEYEEIEWVVPYMEYDRLYCRIWWSETLPSGTGKF